MSERYDQYLAPTLEFGPRITLPAGWTVVKGLHDSTLAVPDPVLNPRSHFSWALPPGSVVEVSCEPCNGTGKGAGGNR